MKMTMNEFDRLIWDLRAIFPELYIYFHESETGRSVIFHADKQITSCAAITCGEKIGYKKLNELTYTQIKARLVKRFKRL